MSAPVMVRAEDVEEQALAVVDSEFMARFGPLAEQWEPWQVEQYLTAINKVHADFAPTGVAA